LIGTGTGLAPLYGILRDALHSGHRGDIRLYHGSRIPEGLYLGDALSALASEHGNFHYMPCLSGEVGACDTGAGGAPANNAIRQGRADAEALKDYPDLTGWQVFICGYPAMVQAAKTAAYLAGASLDAIHADPFEMLDRRGEDRADDAPKPDVW